ncbi:thermonuclease family protein [Candidatus Bipolaricaulota bacterium]|nr:thermonuclease family protein [Candidatus Bipolaricaulota bacterium]
MRKVSIAFILGLLLLSVNAFSSQRDGGVALIEVEVLEVQDGDTFDVYIVSVPEEHRAALSQEIDLEKTPFVRVRLLGINSPEIDHPSVPCECFAEEASYALERLLPEGTSVWLELDERVFDGYSRLLAYVYLDPAGTQMINAMLVANGHAVTLSIAPNVRYEEPFAQLEDTARGAPFGLWSECVFSWENAEDHVGELAVFTGPVAGTHFEPGSGMTYINIGLPYPEPDRLTVIIRGQVRDLFTYRLVVPPEDLFRGADIAILGRIEQGPDGLEIELWEPRYIWIPTREEPRVVIWEVEVNPPDEDSGAEWVKLRNVTDEDVSIGGWLLFARAGRPGAVTIEQGVVISAGGFYIVEHVPFRWLDNENEYIELRDLEGILVDFTPFGALDDTSNNTDTWRRGE